jgi:hypothetical protein
MSEGGSLERAKEDAQEKPLTPEQLAELEVQAHGHKVSSSEVARISALVASALDHCPPY